MHRLFLALCAFVWAQAALAQSLQTQLDATFGTTPGTMIARGVPQWVPLSGGATGQFLTSNGAGQAPSFQAFQWPVTGVGAALGNVDGTGNVTPVTISQLMAVPCSNTQGPVPLTGTLWYWAGTQLACLNPGPANSYLLSQGTNAPPTWVSGGTPGTGTVTSVNVALPSDVFANPGSAITGSGTLTVGLNSQAQNQLWASPSTVPGAPSFRSLVGADLPLPTASTLGGVQAQTAPTNNFQTGISTSGVPTFAQPAFSNLSGRATAAQTPQGAATTLRGNPTGALADQSDVTLGASLAFSGTTLNVATNGVSLAMLSQAPTNTIRCNPTAGTANVQDCTAATVNTLLPVATATVKGLVPVPPNDATKFLNGQGAFTTPTATVAGLIQTGGRLSWNGTAFQYCPFNGNQITISGSQYTIPSACVSLTPSGLTAGTLYYLYLYNNAGTLTIELPNPAVSHVTDTASGMEVKSGDATRVLIGMSRATGAASTVYAAAGAGPAAQHFVRSYYNRVKPALYNKLAARSSITATSWTEIDSTKRVEFLVWGDETVVLDTAGLSIAGASSVAYAGIMIDGTVDLNSSSRNDNPTATPITTPYRSTLSEGYHYASQAAASSTTTAATYGPSAESAAQHFNAIYGSIQ